MRMKVSMQEPLSARRRAPACTLLALAIVLSLAQMITRASVPRAHAQGQVQRIATTGCPTCPHYGYFVHTATAANSAYDYTILNSAYTNGQPNAVLMVTQVWNDTNTSGVYNPHNIGIWYASVYHAWTIFNEDASSIPVGSEFNVNVVVPGSTGSTGNNAFIQQVATGNIVGDSTVLYNPNTDNNASAIILVTPVYGATAEYENHPIGVWYTGSHWAIFNEDLSAMAPGELFDVMVYPAATGYEALGSAYIFTTSASTNIGDSACRLTPSTNGAMFWLTHNWGTDGVLNDHPSGVEDLYANWEGSTWCIFEEDQTAMPVGLVFNVEVLEF
jgi:hypothetical protein